MKYTFATYFLCLLFSCSSQVEKKNTFNGRALPENTCYVLNGGTERPFTGEYWNHKEEGEYICVACDSPLFRVNINTNPVQVGLAIMTF